MSYPDMKPKELVASLMRAERLLSIVARGEYGPRERTELVGLLDISRTKAGIPEKRLSEVANVTTNVMRNTTRGGSPKLQNFMGLAFGLRETFADQLSKNGLLIKGVEANYVRLHSFTDAGTIQKLVVSLEEFSKDLGGRNDPDTYISIETKDALIELLQNLIQQLKSPTVEVKSISNLMAWLKQFSKSVGAKIGNKASDIATDVIVKLITDAFLK